MGKMKSETLEYQHDSVTFRGHLVHDPARTSHLPGVLVVHEAWGISEHVKERAERLAELGYIALAVDMFGEAKQPGISEEGLQADEHQNPNLPGVQARFGARPNDVGVNAGRRDVPDHAA